MMQISVQICCERQVLQTKNLFFKIIYLFILFLAVLGLRFLCEGFLQLWQVGATLHRGARTSHCRGLSWCGAQAPDAQARQLWLTGLVAPRHVGSSQTRARTHVPCIGRRILNHCATREAPQTKNLNATPTTISRTNIDHTFAVWKVLCGSPGCTAGKTRFSALRSSDSCREIVNSHMDQSRTTDRMLVCARCNGRVAEGNT